MTRFLHGKALAAVPLPVLLPARANQSAPVHYATTVLKLTGTEVSMVTRPARAIDNDHNFPPSTPAAIGELADMLRGEPHGRCCETGGP